MSQRTKERETAIANVVERTPEVEPRRFYVLSADIEAHGHTQRLHRMEKRQGHITTNAERESERSLRVAVEPRNRDDEQVAVLHAGASGGDIKENQARRGQKERHRHGQR